MLFTKIGLENFEQTLEVFLERLCKWKGSQIVEETNEAQWLECYLQMAVINLSSMHNYGNNEGSFLNKSPSSRANIDTDPAFAEKSTLTFTVMKQFMSKYLDSLLCQEGNDASEGWLLYCEVVMLWMVADGIFNGFGDETNKLMGMYICQNFWETLATFLTRIACQVSPFTKEKILESSGNISREKFAFTLLHPPLNEDWELRGISWLGPMYDPYLSECETRSHIKFDAYEIDDLMGAIYNERNLSLDQDAKSRRRARIMELGYILSTKIIGFSYNVESASFTSCPELDVECGNPVVEESQPSDKFFVEEKILNESTQKIEFEDSESEIDEHEEDDEGIKELKELKNLLAASRNNGLSAQNPASNVSKAHQQIIPKKALSRIVPGYTILVVDTNCLVGDLVMVKKIICSDNWVVVVPLVVVTELDGLRFNSPPLGTAASEALAFLEQALSMTNKARKVKIQTSKGNYVSGINYSEEFDFGSGEDKKKNMDDLILGICLWHAKNHEEHNYENKNETVVLITNDRNLRVKARARGIEVTGAQDFSGLI
ncbi:3677_t:CDS:2 [Acaulospora colombiana]|uniref:3677_t:CDS:1 n=1 Tax=Acaulospora colombiana TaxID=27376 RepID=A0ACA9KCA5_9GLOM|nr:3677_t:CDS:2 [Acaulospora colombiana]